MTESLHTYDVNMFGSIFVPYSPLAGLGLCHWMISTVIGNLIANDPAKLRNLGEEIYHAMEKYIDFGRPEMTEEAIQYIYEQAMCYYVNVEDYFQHFKLVEHLYTPERQQGVAIIMKD